MNWPIHESKYETCGIFEQANKASRIAGWFTAPAGSVGRYTLRAADDALLAS
jgi:hypothetical protein